MRSASKMAAVALAWGIWALAGLMIASESLGPRDSIPLVPEKSASSCYEQ